MSHGQQTLPSGLYITMIYLPYVVHVNLHKPSIP